MAKSREGKTMMAVWFESLPGGLPTGWPRGHFGIITFTRHDDSPDQNQMMN
jgi:hypothetical protein